jgi:hypothetical protein
MFGIVQLMSGNQDQYSKARSPGEAGKRRNLDQTQTEPGNKQNETTAGQDEPKSGATGKPQKEEPRSEEQSQRKQLSLTDAVRLVEKAKQSKASRAEKLGEGDNPQFNVEVLEQKGSRSWYQVNSVGAVASANGTFPEPARGTSSRFRSLGSSNLKDLKVISLSEAIHLVGHTNKGEVVKGELVGEGASTQFDVTVLGQNGARTQLVVNATGKVIVEAAEPPVRRGGRDKRR